MIKAVVNAYGFELYGKCFQGKKISDKELDIDRILENDYHSTQYIGFEKDYEFSISIFEGNNDAGTAYNFMDLKKHAVVEKKPTNVRSELSIGKEGKLAVWFHGWSFCRTFIWKNEKSFSLDKLKISVKKIKWHSEKKYSLIFNALVYNGKKVLFEDAESQDEADGSFDGPYWY